MKISTKRVYDPPDSQDGKRILVDRLWPRGISKEAGKIDLWLKEISPSDSLRKWYNHDIEHWEEFKTRYFRELDSNPDGVAKLKSALDRAKVTFLYSSKNTTHNNAVALLEYLSV